MKKIITISLILVNAILYSQSSKGSIDSISEKHEVKINGLFLLLGAIEADYQYLINEESGAGIDVLYTFANGDDDLDLNYYVSPYYRQYFGKKYAAGFFIEGFGMLSSVDTYDERFTNISDRIRINEETETNFALGLGVGVKFLSRRNFVMELDLGLGRNLIDTDRDTSFVGKGGISLGYRF